MEEWEHDMEQPTRAGVRAIVLAVTVLFLLPLQAQAERNWEFSVGAFGGKAFHSNEDGKINPGAGSGFGAGTIYGVNFNDSPTFGAKITAWHLPRQYNWQPQIGLELDYTKFTADLDPQTVGASGPAFTPGVQLGAVTFPTHRDFSVNILATNLLFRYPIWATPEMPQGRWYPYIGAGVGVERVRLSDSINSHQETSYSPAFQGMVGLKFFIFRNLAFFGEWKRTMGWHTFTYDGAGAPPGYFEHYTFASNLVVGGIALHF
jgi:opacity protein-like surface antigen